MSYKIYKRNNHVFIDNTVTNKNFSGKINKVSIVKSPNGFFNFSGFENLFFSGLLNYKEVKDLSLSEILKENGTAYTVQEWETFYTTLSELHGLIGGQAAHSAVVTGNPIRTGAKVKTTIDTTLINNDTSDTVCTTDGATIFKQFAVPELDWTFACTTPVNNTTDLVLKASAGAGIRNYITSFQITNASATVATEIVIKNGATIIWKGFAAINTTINVMLQTPLKSTAATALNFACITTGSQVYVNVQGYVAI